MKEKIALINPPSPFLLDERVFPNVGLLYVATQMRKDDYDVKVFDFCGDKNYKESMEKIAKDFDVYAFSSTSSQFLYTYELLEILKKNTPRAFGVIGGSHPSSMFSLKRKLNLKERLLEPNIKSLEEFDLILEGDGEVSYKEIFKQGLKWRKSILGSIDDVPIPAREFYNLNSYHYRLNGQRATTIITQRGCPFDCIFCCGRDMEVYRKSRQHSPEHVAEEMKYLENIGYKAFVWFDDEININPKRLEKISDLIKDKKYIHRGFLRSDLLVKHPESLEALIDMDFVELCIGVESGSKRILDLIHKHTTPEINYEATDMIKKKGMRIKTFTIIGHPSETYEDVMKTREWLIKAKPDNLDIAVLTPYPGSPLYDDAKPSTKFKDYKWEYKGLYFNKPNYSKQTAFQKGIPGQYSCFVRTDELSSEQLLRLRDDLEKEIKSKLKIEI